MDTPLSQRLWSLTDHKRLLLQLEGSLRRLLTTTSSKEKRKSRSELTSSLAATQGFMCIGCDSLMEFEKRKPPYRLYADQGELAILCKPEIPRDGPYGGSPEFGVCPGAKGMRVLEAQLLPTVNFEAVMAKARTRLCGIELSDLKRELEILRQAEVEKGTQFVADALHSEFYALKTQCGFLEIRNPFGELGGSIRLSTASIYEAVEITAQSINGWRDGSTWKEMREGSIDYEEYRERAQAPDSLETEWLLHHDLKYQNEKLMAKQRQENRQEGKRYKQTLTREIFDEHMRLDGRRKHAVLEEETEYEHYFPEGWDKQTPPSRSE